MASSKSVPCGACKQEKVNTQADIWCYNCDEGLCLSCCSHHKKFKSTRDHKTIDIQTYKPPMGSIKTECDKHNQQFNLYCPSHLVPCCDDCINTNHSKCIGIQSLVSVVEKTKIEKSKELVDKDINSTLLFLNRMAKEKASNIKKGKQQCKSIKESIGKIREQINKHLDHLEQKLCIEADTVWGQEKCKLAGFITEIEDKMKIFKEMQDDLHTVTQHTPKLQFFLGVHQIGRKVLEYQRCIEDIENNDMANEVDIKIKPIGEIEKILSVLESLKSFGEVKVSKSDISIKREISMNRKAQIETRKQSHIDKMTMYYETKREDKIKIITRETSDIICLSDGRIVAVEYNGNVYLLTSDGNFQKQLPIFGEARTVTQISKNTIAITYPYDRIIKIFNIEDEIIIKVIKLHNYCCGISFFNESLAVGLDGGEICIIDLEGNTLKSIRVQNKSKLQFLVYSDSRLIFSDYAGKAVYCINESGKQIWQYEHDLEGPRGLRFDTFGNVIVADYKSNKIIVISKDGQDSKVLVRQACVLDHPMFICLRNDQSSGFVCDGDDKYFAKFNLSYD